MYLKVKLILRRKCIKCLIHGMSLNSLLVIFIQLGILLQLYAVLLYVGIIRNLLLNYYFILCFIHLVLSIALVMLMHWLTRLVSWLICVFVIVASIGLTGALWYAYYNIRHKSSEKVQYSLLEEFARNQQAVLTLAVLATITMVIILIKFSLYIFLNI